MRTIWKYPLDIVDEPGERWIPGYAGVAFVGQQNEVLTVWCHIDSDEVKYRVRFVVTGTGNKSPDGNYLYVGSAVCGDYVWHVWENSVVLKEVKVV